MSVLTYALSRIREEIPSELLEVAYNDKKNNRYNVPASIDSIIKEKVLVNKVMRDCNLGTGTEIIISLNSATHEQIDPGVHVYTIPKELTQHRSIMSALSIGFSNSNRGPVHNLSGSRDEILSAGRQQLSSLMSITPISDARVNMVGDNVIMAEHGDNYLGKLFLRCVVEYDSNMSSLNPRSWDNFGTLCVWACKADIYVNNILKLDRGYMTGGSEIGEYKNIIERFSDASETYRDYLNTTWKKVAALNDPEMRERLIRITAGNGG